MCKYCQNLKIDFSRKLYPFGIKDSYDYKDEEIVEDFNPSPNLKGDYKMHRNVSNPGISVHIAPKDKATGAAMIVFPGGGYQAVVIDYEGFEVADWLNNLGITAIVVKYRTIPVRLQIEDIYSDSIVRSAIFNDAREALKVTRENADNWSIDRNKIGVMGFSAGGHLAHSLCFAPEPGEIEKPNFMALIYPAVNADFDETKYPNYPPTFLTITADDRLVDPDKTLELYRFLRKGNISAELHMIACGDHGFLEKSPSGIIRSWRIDLEVWLKGLGMAQL